MTQPGPAYFEESPIFGTTPLLNGVQMSHYPEPMEKVPSRGANVLEHANGTATLQVDYQDDTDPEGVGFYEFRFDVPAVDEANWWNVERLWKQRARFYFIPWDQEEEVILVGRSLSAWVLPRPTAASQTDHSDVSVYPTLAWLDDIEQDVIATGTPGAGEVKVVGSDVTTPTLAAGQVLRVRYAPAYLVAITSIGPQRRNGFNDLVKAVTLTEVREI